MDRYEQHRQAQLELKAAFLRDFGPTYELLDFNRIDETAVPWVQAAMNVVRPYRQHSAELAAQDYSDSRRLYVPGSKAATPAPQVEFENSREQLYVAPARRTKTTIDWADHDRAAERSLLVTGPGELKRQSRLKRPEERAKALGFKQAAGAAARHVIKGARTVTQKAVENDSAAIGWIRVTDGDPCYFCALLASRGPVYKTEQTAAFEAHDDCACIPAVVFVRNAPWPGRSREFRRLYQKHIYKQYSGANAMRAWRRVYEAEQRLRKSPLAA